IGLSIHVLQSGNWTGWTEARSVHIARPGTSNSARLCLQRTKHGLDSVKLSWSLVAPSEYRWKGREKYLQQTKQWIVRALRQTILRVGDSRYWVFPEPHCLVSMLEDIPREETPLGED